MKPLLCRVYSVYLHCLLRRMHFARQSAGLLTITMHRQDLQLKLSSTSWTLTDAPIHQEKKEKRNTD